jgi:hypothetical protein
VLTALAALRQTSSLFFLKHYRNIARKNGVDVGKKEHNLFAKKTAHFILAPLFFLHLIHTESNSGFL